MKKLLTIAALAGVASLSYGQGYVDWANGSTSRVSVNNTTYGTSGGTVAIMAANATTPYYFALFVAPSTDTTATAPNGDPTLNGFTFSGVYGTNTSAGRVAGEPTYSDGSGILINPGGLNQYPAGATANFAIVGWSANLGSTWAAVEPYLNGTPGALGEYIGTAPTLAVVPLATPPNYNNVQGNAAGVIGGFALYQVPIPEPTTFALCGLGAAALVIFRRRN